MPMTKGKLALLLAVATVVLTVVKKPDLSPLLQSNALGGKQANDAKLVASAQLIRPWLPMSEIKGPTAAFTRRRA